MPKIADLFDELLQRGGTDLHIAVGYPPLGRVRGGLVPIGDKPLDAEEVTALLVEPLNPPQRERFVERQQLQLAYAHGDKARFRASYFVKSSGIAATFKLIPVRAPVLADLAAPDALRKLAERRSGLVFVTGPSGSGKSTVVAAMVDHLNRTRACHVVTLEDPIEIVFSPALAQVTQRSIGDHAPSLAAAMRNVLREDADVLVVGELETSATLGLALDLAHAGVLVIAVARTNGAIATLQRAVDTFPADQR